MLGKQRELWQPELKNPRLHAGSLLFERFAVAEHAWQEGYEINWDYVDILDKAKDLQGKEKKTVHQKGSQNLPDEQRRRKRVIAVMVENHAH